MAKIGLEEYKDIRSGQIVGRVYRDLLSKGEFVLLRDKNKGSWWYGNNLQGEEVKYTRCTVSYLDPVSSKELETMVKNCEESINELTERKKVVERWRGQVGL